MGQVYLAQYMHSYFTYLAQYAQLFHILNGPSDLAHFSLMIYEKLKIAGDKLFSPKVEVLSQDSEKRIKTNMGQVDLAHYCVW